MMSTTTASNFTTKLKQFSGTGFPSVVCSGEASSPTDLDLKAERDAAVAAGAGTSSTSGTPLPSGTVSAAVSTTPLLDCLMKQKMASTIILAALREKLAAEVYLLDHSLAMLQHLRITYNVKCSANVGAVKWEYIGLYLDGDESIIEHIQNTRRVLDELQKQQVLISDDEKRQSFM
ncbi:hypothetical protein F444_09811 [Phytophthora nicotianae P1976]|uniref:Uncharacterized protein n=1 Tax=Phytophthora nicotianae P1976 TaxID=1317066 RepID=A0A081A6F9_PHYNI|nr:hypothetical protein F444_09811 [Phytophthora nicotianae P1976]